MTEPLACILRDKNGGLEIAKALIKAGGEELLLMASNGRVSISRAKKAPRDREGSEQGWRGGAPSQDTNQRILLPLYGVPKREPGITTALIEAGWEALLLKTDRAYGLSCLHAA
jgi:hypothetical protein